MNAGWIYITAKDEHECEAIAETLVSEGLAACANIFPKVKSVYRWQGEIQHDQEAAMVVKSDLEKFESVRIRVKELHSYETPCIVAIDWKNCDTAYLKWMVQSIR